MLIKKQSCPKGKHSVVILPKGKHNVVALPKRKKKASPTTKG